MALGILLASFYIVPVLFEKSWITVGQLLAAGVRPEENFLFARTAEAEHDSYLRLLSWLALGELCATAAAFGFSRRLKKQQPKLWWALLTLAGLGLLLMLPLTALAYRLMPDLRFVQFPWRWLLTVGVAYAILVVSSVPQFRGRPWVYGLFFLALIATCNWALQPHCDPADTPFMISQSFRTGYGYMGTDEYVPAGGDNYEIKPDFPELRFRGLDGGTAPVNSRVTHLHATTYRQQIIVESPQPVAIVLRLMNYPAWRVTVNGNRVRSAIRRSHRPHGDRSSRWTQRRGGTLYSYARPLAGRRHKPAGADRALRILVP